MSKSHYLVYFMVAVLIFFGVATARADHPKEVIDGDELQYKADSILKTEPHAKKVKVRVEVEPKRIPNTTEVDFMDFDYNHDGILEQAEVGEKLFWLFDRDGNEVIDNHEMEMQSVLTIIPMERKTIEVVDYDGVVPGEKTKITTEEFLEQSNLMRFDKHKDGLTPLDFLDMSFYEVDVKDDAVIDMEEWQRAYAESVRPAHMEDYNYNS